MAVIELRTVAIPNHVSLGMTRRQAEILRQAWGHYAHLCGLAHSAHPTTLLSVDVEVLERDHQILLEIGLSLVVWRGELGTAANPESYHYIVEDNIDCRNGNRVPDQRDAFLFGTSSHIALSSLRVILDNALSDVTTPITLIAHTPQLDLEMLSKYSSLPVSQISLCDVADAFRWITQDHYAYSLSRIMECLGLRSELCHNAGNDARYTLDAALELMRRYRVSGQMAI